MEPNKDLERMIQETVAIAITSSMKIHTEALEKKLSDKLEVFTARLDAINEKMEKMEKGKCSPVKKSTLLMPTSITL